MQKSLVGMGGFSTEYDVHRNKSPALDQFEQNGFGRENYNDQEQNKCVKLLHNKRNITYQRFFGDFDRCIVIVATTVRGAIV